jgi:bud site selection protein 20
MGNPQGKKPGARSKQKEYKRKVWLKNRDRDVDQIQEDIEKSVAVAKPVTFEYDDDLPGGGQFYAVETGKHFIDAKALADHRKTKFFKRRVKHLKEEKYTQGTADWGAGITKEKLPAAHEKLPAAHEKLPAAHKATAEA